MNLHRRATSPGGGAGRRDLDHVSVAAGVAFAPGRLAIALPVQEQGAKNTLFFASYSILSVTQRDSVGFRCNPTLFALSEADCEVPVCLYRRGCIAGYLGKYLRL